MCTTVDYSTIGTTNVMVAAYNGSFDPNNPTTNFLGGPATTSSCGGAAGSFTFAVPAGATFVIVVSECTPGSGGHFSLTVTTDPKVLAFDLKKTADATTVTAGSQAGFKVELENLGIIDIDGVTMTDVLPGGPGIDWSLAADSGPDWAITGAAPSTRAARR